jgi:hypothetical protein
MLRRCSSVWLACAALGATCVARAEPKQGDITFAAVLEYVAPPSCPSVDDFKSLIVGRIGFDPFNEQAPQHVLVAISADEPRLAGRIEWRDAKGKWAGDQAFPAKNDDCSELARAMAFALAVQIHLLAAERSLAEPLPAPARPEHETATPGRQNPPPPTTAGKGAAARDSSAAESDDRRRSVPLAFIAGAGGSLALGMAPGVMPLGRVFGAVAYGAAWFELGGEISTRVSEFRADGAGFSQRALLVSAAGCGSYGMFSGCVLGKGGVIQVEGEQIDVPASPTGSAFQLGLRLGAREELGPSAFFAQRLEGLVNVTRWTVRLDALPVWTAPPVTGVLGLDFGLTFR